MLLNENFAINEFLMLDSIYAWNQFIGNAIL